MSDVRNRSFLIRLAFDPILKPRLCGVQNALACARCREWYQSKIYFRVPQNLSKIEDLVALVRVEHGIQSEICFNVDGYNVPLHLPIEHLREIKEPIEVVPIGPEVPEVSFPTCNCATAADSDQVDQMILKLSGTKIGNSAEINVAGTCHKPGGGQTSLIPCCQNIELLDGENELLDRHQSSNSSSRLADVATSEETSEVNGSQDGVLDQSEDPIASGTATHVSSSSTHESLSTQGSYGSEESGVSTGSEDMGSAMAIFSKDKSQNEHGSAVSGSDNTSTSNLEETNDEGQSENSSAQFTQSPSSAEETIESGEKVDETEETEEDEQEHESPEILMELTLSNASILEENIREETTKRSGSEVTAGETGIPEKKTRSDAMIPDDESLRTRELLTGEMLVSDDTEDFHEGLNCPWASTPKPSIDITNGTSPFNPPNMLDSTTASEDGSNGTILSQDDFDEEDQECTEKLFTKSIFA